MSLTFSAVFGLAPGYGFTHTPTDPDELVAGVVRSSIEEVWQTTGVVVGCVVTPGRVFYPSEFGCPAHGEMIITVTGAHNPKFCGQDSWREAATAVVEFIKEGLGQERVTLVFSPVEDVEYMEPGVPVCLPEAPIRNGE